MKSVFNFLSICLVTISLNAQNIVIVDANLKASLVNNESINTNGDSDIQLTEANAFIGVLNVSYSGITDLTGVETFVNTKVINCTGNSITNFNFHQNIGLQSLYINDNQFITLDVSSNLNLIYLQCNNNQITSINFGSNSSVRNLYCSDNEMLSLDVANLLQVKEIFCFNNPLTTFNAFGCVNLIRLDCSATSIGVLDLNTCASLIDLDCSNGTLSSLYIANGSNGSVQTFDARNNPNLFCIEVDNVFNAISNWPNKDAIANYNQNCP